MMEAFIGGLPQSIEGNVTASKPQTLEKAINISQRLMDQSKGLSGVGRGVKEKQFSFSMADKSVEGEKHVNVVNAGSESFPTISEAHGIQSSSSNEENMNDVGTTMGPNLAGNTPVESIRVVSGQFANSAYGFFLGKKVAYPVVDENLLNEDVSIVPVWVKLYGVPVTDFSEDGLTAIATKLGVGEKKNVKKPSQATRGVLVGLKMDFKSQKEYRPVTKKPNTISSGNKKKGVEPTIEAGNSNPFDVLNSVDIDVEFGTNGGTSNLENNEATPSGSSFMNINNDVEFASNTPIGEKIDKIEHQIGEGKLRMLDNDGNPLVPMGIMESDSEVEVVYAKTANLMILTSGNDRSDKGYGTNSLLE
nr:reverse transcriptase domain-containing protein [Tanacetum cinerariifolium]